MTAIQTILNELRAWLAGSSIGDLASSRHHTPYLERHRLAAIVVRIRLAAAAFAVLTLLWIPLDAASLPSTQWKALAAFRVGAVVLFALLAFAPDSEKKRGTVIAMLGALLAAPMAIYCAAGLLVDGGATGLGAINAQLYAALPFIVLAGLSLFPLVAIEGLAFALPIAAIVAAVQIARSGADTVALLSSLWVLALTLGVYLLACGIQLHYMMALLRRASHDPLTGALTRRSGMELLEFQFRLACDQEAPLAVAFFDVDNFKRINDDYGHGTGDQVLRQVVVALEASMRQSDVVIRWGGEEFVAIFANTPPAGVRVVMARVIEDWLGRRPDGVPVTASIGIAERVADGVGDWVRLVALADQRMYMAKTTGKARCVLGAGDIMLPGRPAP